MGDLPACKALPGAEGALMKVPVSRVGGTGAWAAVWVLGTEVRSCVRAAGVQNHGAISSAPTVGFFFHCSLSFTLFTFLYSWVRTEPRVLGRLDSFVSLSLYLDSLLLNF